MLGDCVQWIVRKIHGDTCLCIVWLAVEQQYGESPDVYNSSTVKPGHICEHVIVSECAERAVREYSAGGCGT